MHKVTGNSVFKKLRLYAYHWQAVTVPAKPSFNMKSTLMRPSCHNILDCSSKYVAVVWQASCKWRPVIKCVSKNTGSTVNYCLVRPRWHDMETSEQLPQISPLANNAHNTGSYLLTYLLREWKGTRQLELWW